MIVYVSKLIWNEKNRIFGTYVLYDFKSSVIAINT